MYTIIDRMTSGMISDGGITCNKYWRFWSFISRHCRISPSWPKDALTVGNPKADVNDFTVSEATFVIVVSNTMCGGWLFFTASVYTEQTAHFSSKTKKRIEKKTKEWTNQSISFEISIYSMEIIRFVWAAVSNLKYVYLDIAVHWKFFFDFFKGRNWKTDSNNF